MGLCAKGMGIKTDDKSFLASPGWSRPYAKTFWELDIYFVREMKHITMLLVEAKYLFRNEIGRESVLIYCNPFLQLRTA